jgi:methylenetetrahydrofolate dehydrogenase (NADP+)/methenyltetrahydrofolate cyclohydrolase
LKATKRSSSWSAEFGQALEDLPGEESESGGLDRCLVHQHDGNVVLHCIYPVALRTLQTFWFFPVYESLLARRTNQDFQQFLGNHGWIVPHDKINSPQRDRNTEYQVPRLELRHVSLGTRYSQLFGWRACDRISTESNMPARILDGTRIASDIRHEVAAEVKNMAAAGIRPGLAVVLVGRNPASEIYVRGKVKACEQVGVYGEQHTPPETATTGELLALIDNLNHREEIDGILVQLPLPGQVDAKRVLMAVDPAKDVDGFHPVNVGFLSTQRPGLVPCTPAGVIEILKRSQIPVSGQEAVVVGRSDIVGKPAAMLLINANATVTVCHSKTHDLPGVCRRADILVAAIGRAGMITRDFIKPGATVIDVGMNKVTDAAEFQRLFAGNAQREQTFRAKGSTLIGDVHPEVAEVAGALTPVPGGVGPLTIAMLMYNTVKAAKMRRGSQVPELSRA